MLVLDARVGFVLENPLKVRYDKSVPYNEYLNAMEKLRELKIAMANTNQAPAHNL